MHQKVLLIIEQCTNGGFGEEKCYDKEQYIMKLHFMFEINSIKQRSQRRHKDSYSIAHVQKDGKIYYKYQKNLQILKQKLIKQEFQGIYEISLDFNVYYKLHPIIICQKQQISLVCFYQLIFMVQQYKNQINSLFQADYLLSSFLQQQLNSTKTDLKNQRIKRYFMKYQINIEYLQNEKKQQNNIQWQNSRLFFAIKDNFLKNIPQKISIIVQKANLVCHKAIQRKLFNNQKSKQCQSNHQMLDGFTSYFRVQEKQQFEFHREQKEQIIKSPSYFFYFISPNKPYCFMLNYKINQKQFPKLKCFGSFTEDRLFRPQGYAFQFEIIQSESNNKFDLYFFTQQLIKVSVRIKLILFYF
ncbi:unnamed protein product [Paramecium primaurelia]|uniref:Uncharacterized protein n=1 Tax=Paramecium primaurelia TaxID=5886 RepID=A0A8S1NXT3_PARPR|nr:unnamed protein product [Paramecium primaurelia]